MSSPSVRPSKTLRNTSAPDDEAERTSEAFLHAFFKAHRLDPVSSSLRDPVAAIAVQRHISRLSVIDANLTDDGDAEIVRAGLLRPHPFARKLIRGTTALLVMPDTVDEFLAGSSESKRSLRTKYNRGTRRGFQVLRLEDRAARLAILASADAYEREHPVENYRNAEPDNDYLLDVATWLLAADAEGKPLILAVPGISGEWAVLQHFKTLEWSDDARLARHWMSVELVRELRARGVRYLADTLSPVGLPPGLREFQHRLGYRLHRVRIHAR